MILELKPCPFCGETYIIKGDFDFRGDGPDKFPNDVVCSGCGIGYCGHDFKGQGDAAVVNAWNRRSDAAEIDRLRGVLAVAQKDSARYNHMMMYHTRSMGDGHTEPQEEWLELMWQQGPAKDGKADQFPGWDNILDAEIAALAEGNGQEGGV